jgi:hypothetical protein
LDGSFLTYKRARWFWITALSAGALTLHYLTYSSETIPYGGTAVGLTYGLLATILIAVLMVLGIRKRSYSSGKGTLQGWVSAHVYLGLFTLLIIPMHAGFRFGADIHTLAFILLAIVVFSGIIGVILYMSVPSRLTEHESGLQSDAIDKEIGRLLSDMRFLVKDKSDALVQVYQDEIARLQAMRPMGWSLLFTKQDEDLIAKRSAELAQIVTLIPSEDESTFQALSQLILKKTQLQAALMTQMRLRNVLQAWLYVHVPVSIAMILIVGLHIVVVFYY